MKMNKEMLLVGLLAVMFLVSTVQAVQLVSIKNDLEEGKLPSLGSSTSGAKKIASKTVDIQAEIPDQVGGCF